MVIMERTTKSALYLHALTPVHAGTGQASASAIDLPIAREKATGWPILPATSIKGVLRAAVKDMMENDEEESLFGSRNSSDPNGGRAGSLQIGDARLLCFPVRSWKGVFAYATCPLILRRLKRDFRDLGIPMPVQVDIPPVENEQALTAEDSLLIEANNKTLWLDDLELISVQSPTVKEIAVGIAQAVFTDEAEHESFIKRFVILSDDVFDFLAEFATEVTARIELNECTKTVKPGGLWYEEAIPAEAIFVAPMLGARIPKLPATLQIGGNESVGRGLCRVMVQP